MDESRSWHTDEDDSISEISSPGHQHRRSSSWSLWPLRKACDQFSHTKRKQRESLLQRDRGINRPTTFHDLVTSNKARQELGRRPKYKEWDKSGVYQESTCEENRDRRKQGISSIKLRATSAEIALESGLQDCKDDDFSKSGTTVHRSHMGTVSKDDYLLARGANPRTGIVTPRWNLESPIDERGALKSRGSSVPSKWRQRGDQWITLDVDQLTPGFDPPSRALSCSKRHLRTPSRLTAGRYNHSVPMRDITSTSKADPFVAKHSSPRLVFREHVPDQAQNPEQQTKNSESTMSCTDPNPAFEAAIGVCPSTRIPRKPIGSPPSKTTDSSLPAMSLHGSIPQVSMDNSDRSFSAPIFHEHKLLGPNGVGKKLPPLPQASQDIVQKQHVQGYRNSPDPFLGRQEVNWVEDVLHPYISRNTEPLCQSTNGVRSQDRPSGQIKMEIPQALTIPSQGGHGMWQVPKPRGPRGGGPTYPHIRSQKPQIPPRQYHMAQDLRVGQKIAGHVRSVQHQRHVRVVHPQVQPQSMRGRMSGPRMIMEKQEDYHHPGLIQEVFTTSPSITSTSTNIFIPSSGKSTNTSQDVKNSSERMSSIAMPRHKPRGLSRPQMPDRTDEQTCVPKASPEKQSPPLPDLHQWRMLIGMRDSTSVEENDLERVSGPLKSITDIDATGMAVREHRGAETVRQDPGTSLNRNCSRCHGRSFSDKNRKVPRSILTSESQDRGSVELGNNENKARSADSIECSRPLLNDIRDHNACCPECCTLDCHEGCLGHPSTPSIASDAADVELENQPGKFDFVRQALRNLPPFKHRSKSPTRSPGAEQAAQVVEGETLTAGKGHGAGGAQKLFCGDTSPVALIAARRAMAIVDNSSPSNANTTRKVSAPANTGVTSRNVSWATTINPADNNGTKATGTRKISGASVRTIEVPGLGTVGDLVESFLIPIGALRMWIRQHPQVLDFAYALLQRAVEMIWCVLKTADRIYRISYVYSKTGKVKVEDVGALVRDCARSVVYSLVLGAVVVFLARLLGLLIGIGGWVVTVFRGVGWVLCNMGMGILW